MTDSRDTAAQRRQPHASPRLRGPGDLIQAVPYLLGFHPAQSLVLLGLAGGQLVVTARVDLDDLADAQLLPELAASLARGGSRELVAIVYDDAPPQPLPWRGVATEVLAAGESHSCPVVDVLRVAAGRWWSYLCGDAACCPAEGTALPVAPSAFVADATVAGTVALPDRDALAATLDPLRGGERDALLPRLESAQAMGGPVAQGGREHRRDLRAILARARRADTGAAGAVDGELSPEELVRCGAALRAIAIRDGVWTAIEGRRVDGRDLWAELARRLPAPYDAAPLFLLGWASWRAGNGALARIAGERAIASDPGYSAADLLLAAISHGLNPHQVPRLRLPRASNAA